MMLMPVPASRDPEWLAMTAPFTAATTACAAALIGAEALPDATFDMNVRRSRYSV